MSAVEKQVRAAWTQPSRKSTDFEHWKRVFWENASDYCSSTTLHGYRYLTEDGLHWIERLMWVTVHIMATWGVSYSILDVWQDYLNAPIFTTVHTTAYPISKISFPAVAVCSNNKISYKRARRLTEQLASSRNVSAEELFNLIPNMGRMFDFNDRGREQVQLLHEMLTANNHTYNVTNLMLKMSPSCEALVVRCKWGGRKESCRTLFTQRRTMEGFCCTFNYVRDRDDFVVLAGNQELEDNAEYPDDDENDERIKRASIPGSNMGLSIVVNSEIDDYYFPLISSYGTKVLLFKPNDYPDTASGGLVEHLVPVGAEVSLRLQATSVYADASIKGFTLKQRGCLFKSELSQLFAGSYSFSDCVISCRVRSIRTLCGCTPFFYPSLGASRTCDLSDIDCLARYADKWTTLRPARQVPGLEKEREVSISCEECRPACSDTSYHVQTTWAGLSRRRYESSDFLDGLTNLSGHSMVHLFFGTGTTTRFEKQVLYYWYDLLSNFGGICGLFVGFSLISVVELVYFFTVRFLLLARDRNRRPGHAATLKSPQLTGIYWREVAPSLRVGRH
ncbi:sodium channel protein Nach-like [Bacillus rossius redtenbacheri]|uniref:sodium channel protein Nach-like n=1 Tax=Bacillus rossius redtenbacheri TaxID=93214 RepID=UPI002FDE906E